MSATFNLSTAPVGNYAIKVSAAGKNASTAQSFTVFAPSNTTTLQDNNSIVASLEAPSAVRAGQVYSLTINYSSDAPDGFTVQAPILQLSADNVEFALPGQTAFTPGSISLLGINSTGEAGVLPRAQGPLVETEHSIAVSFIATVTGSVALQPGRRRPNGCDRLELLGKHFAAARRFECRLERHLCQLHCRGRQHRSAGCKRPSTTTPPT